mmetsp:Transcript_5764/g.8578  ORF Transcript_5764/g.8578 Transcript_5764/m.8578 type:complete len:116 (-) Transcript_5764:221-568(-)
MRCFYSCCQTNKFENMGKSILNRIDDMGDRIDNLEKSIGELMDVTDTQAMANTPTNIMTTAGSKIGSSSSSSVPYHHNTATTTTSNNSTHPQLLDAHGQHQNHSQGQGHPPRGYA